jgi:hypothetical protein
VQSIAGASYTSGTMIMALSGTNTAAMLTIGTASGNIPDAEGVRDLIGATMVAGPGLYSIVNDSGDTVTFYRDDRSCVVLEPYYLPQITSSGAAYHSIVSTERLVPTYSGALAAIQGSGDIGTGATGITASAVAQLRGSGSALRISTLYDQSGNGRNAAQATTARQPGLHDQVLVNGKPWILFDGKRSDLTDQNPHPVGLDLTLSLNSRSNTRIMLIDPTASIVAQEFERCDTSPGKNLYTLSGPGSPYTPVNSGNLQYGDASAAASFAVKAPSSPFVLAVRDSASGQDLFVNGDKYTSATVPASTTLTAFKWGYTSGVSLDQFWANFRGAAYITISGNVSDHDIQQITRCLLYRWGLLRDKLPRVALIGDSISEGVAALLTQNGPFWWRDDIGQPVESTIGASPASS